jgi:hypothetical protein
LPIGLNHEDCNSNQGSGDAGAPNLPIVGRDHEDEDGDNESHSPSIYLNLNQDENEEDATNVEHEGNENEEDEGNAKQALVGSLPASQVSVAVVRTSFLAGILSSRRSMRLETSRNHTFR